MQGLNLYIHIPFCASRCSYCDFYTQTHLGLRMRFMEALLGEIELRRQEFAGRSIDHIYLGGGTPSLLSGDELGRLFARLKRLAPVSPSAEITMECNPDDLTEEYADVLARLPVNRVSMGVQSFHADDLKFLGRRHSVRQVFDAVSRLRSRGINNLSLDLIYGLPGQTPERWRYNVDTFLSLDIAHLSAYHLIYEEGTLLSMALERGHVREVDEEVSLELFSILIGLLEDAGYEQYEISNFARGGAYARLNTGYWQGKHYVGLGPSAHSYNGESRGYNPPSIERYADLVSEGVCPTEWEHLSRKDVSHEYIMTRLRTQWGISLDDFAHTFSPAEMDRLKRRAMPLVQEGLLSLEEGRLRLTRRGIFVSDGIIVELFD